MPEQMPPRFPGGLRMRPAALLLAAALLALATPPAMAQEAPREGTAARAYPACDAAHLGAVACLDGVLCECVAVRGGAISGELSGVRWNCDALRPRCPGGQAGDVPATLPPAAFPYPHSVGIDRSSETTVINQNQTSNQTNEGGNAASGP